MANVPSSNRHWLQLFSGPMPSGFSAFTSQYWRRQNTMNPSLPRFGVWLLVGGTSPKFTVTLQGSPTREDADAGDMASGTIIQVTAAGKYAVNVPELNVDFLRAKISADVSNGADTTLEIWLYSTEGVEY